MNCSKAIYSLLLMTQDLALVRGYLYRIMKNKNKPDFSPEILRFVFLLRNTSKGGVEGGVR